MINVNIYSNFEKGGPMLSREQFIRISLEFNLFFLRIAKEHAIFAAAAAPPRDAAVSRQFVSVKNSYEKLLKRSVLLSDNLISDEVLASNEIVTPLTLPAESATEFLTGIPIDKEITRMELNLVEGKKFRGDLNLFNEVSLLNREAMTLTERTVDFLTRYLNSILACRSFSYVYPTMLHHVTEESKFALMMLNKFQNKDSIDSIKEAIEQEIFWTHIMEEHSEFIRGYLDPSEKALFKKADDFAEEFEELLKRIMQLRNNPKLLEEITREAIKEVTALRNFKRQGAEGILACKIKSVIPPLLADHVLREANHYLRILKMIDKMK